MIAVLLTVITWRRYVRWTVLRSMSTGVLAALVLSQVALWRPLWPSGCTTIDDAQCMAQSLATLGVGLTAFAFLWWRTRRATDARRGAADIAPGRFIMSPGAARLTIGVALGSRAGAPLETLAVCPTCGYSLRGLREVRCPECGWASTVEDIVARSLERVVAAP